MNGDIMKPYNRECIMLNSLGKMVLGEAEASVWRLSTVLKTSGMILFNLRGWSQIEIARERCFTDVSVMLYREIGHC